MNFFYKEQTKNKKNEYIKLLSKAASLSKMYTDNGNAFLQYRVMENIFCEVFEAENLSRSDISFDATKDKKGIGLKTFLHGNGCTYQKIAEFNKDAEKFTKLKGKEKVKCVSNLRNDRIRACEEIYGINDSIYHIITREKNLIRIYEEKMSKIDVSALSIKKNNKGSNNIIYFSDGNENYSFNISKSTLYKEFNVNNMEECIEFSINISNNPFDLIKETHLENLKEKSIPNNDYIVLPLYSERNKKVMSKSGLNMWNAGGRSRDKDEVYIPIPAWIHSECKGFFKYINNKNRTDSFNVLLPNKEVIQMKVTQQGGKALQSNPNKALGKWILRDILNIKVGKLVTIDDLERVGIDSVILTKNNYDSYSLDFLPLGGYEKYKCLVTSK